MIAINRKQDNHLVDFVLTLFVKFFACVQGLRCSFDDSQSSQESSNGMELLSPSVFLLHSLCLLPQISNLPAAFLSAFSSLIFLLFVGHAC